MLGGNGFPKATPLLGAELAKRNSCDSAVASVEEGLTKKGSEVQHVESNHGNVMVGLTLPADPVTGMKSDSLPSLFDPDVPLTLSRAEVREKTTTKASMTDFSGDGGGTVSVVDKSGLESAFLDVESPVDMSFWIQYIMEEMTSVPNLLSPLNPEPETGRSHCPSMYYLSLLCLLFGNYN
jgi:hypothetical protein